MPNLHAQHNERECSFDGKSERSIKRAVYHIRGLYPLIAISLYRHWIKAHLIIHIYIICVGNAILTAGDFGRISEEILLYYCCRTRGKKKLSLSIPSAVRRRPTLLLSPHVYYYYIIIFIYIYVRIVCNILFHFDRSHYNVYVNFVRQLFPRPISNRIYILFIRVRCRTFRNAEQ